MSDTIYFPALDESSWITASNDIVEKLFSQFFLTDYSQTQLYLGKVSSFAYVIQKAQGDVSSTIELLKTTLQTYFGRYFPSVSIDIQDTSDTSVSVSFVALTMYLSIVDSSGNEVNLSKVIQTQNGVLKQIINYNNTGSVSTT